MNEAKVYKSKKTVLKSGTISWRPRWLEFDRDGTRKVKNGTSQPSKALADAFSQKQVETINRRYSLQLVAEEEEMTVGQFAEDVWLKAERQIKIKNKAQVRKSMSFWKNGSLGYENQRSNEKNDVPMCKF